MGYNHERYARRVSSTQVNFRPLGVTLDDTRIYANSVDNLPQIQLNGNASLVLYGNTSLDCNLSGGRAWSTTWNGVHSVIKGTTVTAQNLEFHANSIDTGATIILEGNGDVVITPTAGSYIKYGTHVGTGDVASNGHIIIEDSGGTPRKLMTTA